MQKRKGGHCKAAFLSSSSSSVLILFLGSVTWLPIRNPLALLSGCPLPVSLGPCTHRDGKVSKIRRPTLGVHSIHGEDTHEVDHYNTV